jgi:hypothetical protein
MRLINILDNHLVFLVDIVNVNIACIVCCIEFVVDSVPANTGVNSLIGVFNTHLLGSLSSFKPVQTLVPSNGENKVFTLD